MAQWASCWLRQYLGSLLSACSARIGYRPLRLHKNRRTKYSPGIFEYLDLPVSSGFFGHANLYLGLFEATMRWDAN